MSEKNEKNDITIAQEDDGINVYEMIFLIIYFILGWIVVGIYLFFRLLGKYGWIFLLLGGIWCIMFGC